MEYTDLAIDITNKIGKGEKKDNGIFFTPQTTINTALDRLGSFKPKRILEPSCGACGFITAVCERFPEAEVVGVELNPTIYENIASMSNDRVTIHHNDFIQSKLGMFDLIIGNPPYFVIPKKDVPKSYHKFFTGRPNIFILFIVKSLAQLNPSGILSFVLPRSFLNSHYYQKVREHIAENYTILDINDCSAHRYIETQQDTFLITIQNIQPVNDINTRFIINIASSIAFNTEESIVSLKELIKGSTTLHKIGCNVSIGKVVWNQKKHLLTDDSNHTRLIYQGDFKNKILNQPKQRRDPTKKNFINMEGSTDVILVVPRGYGVGEYKFDYCLIDTEHPYQVENHLICISIERELKRNDKKIVLSKIATALDSIKTKRFVELYIGNHAINATELHKVLPVFLE